VNTGASLTALIVTLLYGSGREGAKPPLVLVGERAGACRGQVPGPEVIAEVIEPLKLAVG
jgi:hypothetical protein